MNEDTFLEDLNWAFYCQTEGCYVISDHYNVIVAYKCFEHDHLNINLDGDCLYIKYLRGNMRFLLEFASPDIKKIGFERLNRPDFTKFYDFERIKHKVLRN